MEESRKKVEKSIHLPNKFGSFLDMFKIKLLYLYKNNIIKR
jgi:hypothetical protein